MRVAYLMNTYPVTSGTFIRSEIHAHEAAGLPVLRLAIRRWDQELVDPRDAEEARRTRYILERGGARLGFDLLREGLSNPRGLGRGIAAAARLAWNARGGAVRHAAYLAEAVQLKRDCAAEGIAHVHAHWSTNTAAAALIARRMGGPSYSFTAHGPDEFHDVSGNSTAEKVAGASFVAAITRFCRELLNAVSGNRHARKLAIVRCGLDLPAFDAAADAAPAPGGSTTLVCVGRLCWQKAQVQLVHAVGRLKDRHPDLRLVLIGDGDTRGEIEEAVAALVLRDRVRILGWRSGAEVREALSDARALVLPSWAEGLPIVIMEALALGRPVVTTDIAGIPELVDDGCGWVVPPGDLDALTDALDAAMAASPETLAAMGAEGRARVARLHDQAANAAALRALFARAVAAGPDGTVVDVAAEAGARAETAPDRVAAC